MYHRSTDSAMASASRESFLLDFTNGFTNCRWNQLHVVALCSQNPAKKVGSRTSFHPD